MSAHAPHTIARRLPVASAPSAGLAAAGGSLAAARSDLARAAQGSFSRSLVLGQRGRLLGALEALDILALYIRRASEC